MILSSVYTFMLYLMNDRQLNILHGIATLINKTVWRTMSEHKINRNMYGNFIFSRFSCQKVCFIKVYLYLCSNRTRLHPIRTASESFLHIDLWIRDQELYKSNCADLKKRAWYSIMNKKPFHVYQELAIFAWNIIGWICWMPMPNISEMAQISTWS